MKSLPARPDLHGNRLADSASPAERTTRPAEPPGNVRVLTLPARPLQPYTAVIDGRLLRKLRRQRGLSLENLAWQSGVGLTTLGRLEREARPHCRINTLALLAKELGEDPANIAILVRLNKNAPPTAPQARQSAPASRD